MTLRTWRVEPAKKTNGGTWRLVRAWAETPEGGAQEWVHTWGLSISFNMPEVVVAGLSIEDAERIVTQMVELGRQSCDAAFGAQGVRLRAVDTTRNGDLFFASPPPQAYQVLWPDPRGRFPGENCDAEVAALQLILSDDSVAAA